MPVYALGGLVPSIDGSAFVHPEAVVIGAVTIGADASVWPMAVLRADFGPIRVGAATSVQDGCVLHADRDAPTTIGERCIIGHLAHLEGCVVEDECLVGAGAVVLKGARVCSAATVAAGAVVREQQLVPAGRLVVGVPARLVAGGWSSSEIAGGAALYVSNALRHRAELRRID